MTFGLKEYKPMTPFRGKILAAVIGWLGLQAPLALAAEPAAIDTSESVRVHLADAGQTVSTAGPLPGQILADTDNGADGQAFAQVDGPDHYPEPDEPLKPK